MLLFEKIITDILQQQEIALTEDQEQAVQSFLEFHESDQQNGVFVLRGIAGTGKTFLINLLTRFLRKMGYKTALLAPTGRAAKVITSRTARYASTLHRYIFSPLESPHGGVVFHLKENKDPEKMYYIVDEASMVGDRSGKDEPGGGLLSEFLKFAQQGSGRRRVIFVGDPAQLPPVGSSVSPALDPVHLRKVHRLQPVVTELREVMRQEGGSEILRLASEIRNAMEENRAPSLDIDYRGDVQIIDQGYEGLELYTGMYDPDNMERVVFLTYSNHLATRVNEAIRNQMYGVEDRLVEGELLMVVRNNYAWGDKKFPFIANGEMGVVRHLHPETYEEKYGLEFMDVDIEFQNLSDEPILINCKIVLNLLSSKQPQLGYNEMQPVVLQRRREYETMPKTKAREEWRKDPYVNALQVKYGYAVTGHKAQGGQWNHVIIGFEPMYSGMNLKDYLRWSYTAFTRAEEALYLLDCPFIQKEF